LRRPLEPGQYTAIRFTQRLEDAGIRPSMGSAGDSLDNALAENFFSILKVERVYRTSYRTREEAELDLFCYIDGRIPLPGRPMVEPRRQHPLSGHVLDTAVAAPCANVLVQVAHRLADTGVRGRKHCPPGRWVAQAVEDRHALGRAQHDVERGHSVAAVGAAEKLAGVGVAALEHALEPRNRCFVLQAERCCSGAVPPARGLTVPRTGTLRGRWPAPGCSTPPALPTASRCRPPPSRSLLAFVGASNAPLVHCWPWNDSGRA
jgi:hypothetical protein